MKFSFKTILIIGIFSVVVAIAFWFSARSATPQNNVPTPTRTVGVAPRDIPPLPASPIQNKQSAVKFILAFAPISVPEKLPVYNAREQNVSQVETNVAQSLGFSGSGTTPTDTPTMKWWINSVGTLKIYTQPSSVAFTSTGDPVGPPTEQEAAAAIREFTSKARVVNGAITLTPTKTQFVVIHGSSYLPTQSAQGASMAISSLRYEINGFPLVSADGLLYEAVAQVHAGGVLRSASLPIPPIITSSSDLEAVPLARAAALLSTGKGTLVSVQSLQPTEASISDIDFSSVAISSVSLAYLYNPRDSKIKPVYQFSGKVISGTGDSRNAAVVFFVSATYE